MECNFRSNSLAMEGPFFKRLTETQCEDLHYASLEILQRTGVYFEDEAAVSILKKGGATSIDGNRLSIPAHLVEWALRTAPKQIVLYDRNGKLAIKLGGYRYYYGVGSDGNNILDHRSGERREGKLSDVEEGARLCDALTNIDFVMSMFIPKDVSQEIMDRFQMEAMLKNTKKPIAYVNSTAAGMKDCIRMSEIVAGGEEELRRRPFIVSYNNMARALMHNRETTQKIMYAATKGLPCVYTPPKTVKGAITPVTTAGYLAVSNAGQLAGLVLAQLTREGAPSIIEGGGGGVFDMRTTAGSFTPDNHGFAQELAHFYKMPMFGLGGYSTSMIVDGQAAAEAALTILLQALSGSGLIHDVGYLESVNTYSFEQVVICNEIISWVKHFMKGLNINKESLALDVIDEVEPNGSYLEQEHTFNHFREEWYPDLFDRNRYDSWVANGKKPLQQRAKERVDEILMSHKPEPLPENVIRKLKEVVAQAVN